MVLIALLSLGYSFSYSMPGIAIGVKARVVVSSDKVARHCTYQPDARSAKVCTKFGFNSTSTGLTDKRYAAYYDFS